MARKRTRRIVERTAKNAAAREAGIDLAEDAPRRKLRYIRHSSWIEWLAARGLISDEQRWAAERLLKDYRGSDSQIGRLVASYAFGNKRPCRYAAPPPDAPRVIAARERFERALADCGELAEILIHVVVVDQPANTWRANGKPNRDAISVLRAGLDLLIRHYDRPRRLAAEGLAANDRRDVQLGGTGSAARA